MGLAGIPNGSSDVFIAFRSGQLIRINFAEPSLAKTVADLNVLAGTPVGLIGEGGFLGFAVHPDFPKNGRVFVSWTSADASPNNFVRSRVGYVTSLDGGQSFTSYVNLIEFEQDHGNHYGGGIAFGRDGRLYLSFGDGGSSLGQRTDTFFGKVLRIDVDAGSPYTIPNDNPFRLGGGEPATFAYGFRNPFRISIDRETGDLWLADVGQNKWEEIDRVALGGNYGWPCREGRHPFTSDPTLCPSNASVIDPIFEHEHVAGVSTQRSITGGVVYRGRISAAYGSYIYGDFQTQELFRLSFNRATGAASSELLNPSGPFGGWVGFGEDASGEVYALDLGGSIYKMVAATDAGVSGPGPETLSQRGCLPSQAAGLIPYDVNAPFWSDGADKERFIGLPDGRTINVAADGDFEFPNGSVLVKTFSVGSKKIETRLFMRHEDGNWAGYSYEWLDDQSDAVLLADSKRKRIAADRDWYFPSRAECMRCHTERAGRTLGLELGQLNRDFVYVSTNRISNQLDTFDRIGLFTTPLASDASPRPLLPSPSDPAQPLEARSRAYLHSNCAGCHRPPGEGRALLDLRFTTPLKDTLTCNVAPLAGDQGTTGAKLLTPGNINLSLLSLRPHATTAARMPPLASSVVDTQGLDGALDAWIKSLTACPQ